MHWLKQQNASISIEIISNSTRNWALNQYIQAFTGFKGRMASWQKHIFIYSFIKLKQVIHDINCFNFSSSQTFCDSNSSTQTCYSPHGLQGRRGSEISLWSVEAWSWLGCDYHSINCPPYYSAFWKETEFSSVEDDASESQIAQSMRGIAVHVCCQSPVYQWSTTKDRVLSTMLSIQSCVNSMLIKFIQARGHTHRSMTDLSYYNTPYS